MTKMLWVDSGLFCYIFFLSLFGIYVSNDCYKVLPTTIYIVYFRDSIDGNCLPEKPVLSMLSIKKKLETIWPNTVSS